MSAADVIGAALIGALGGATGGVLGVGGGILFVPALVLFLDQSQLHAEATSLLAVVVVGLVGASRQHRYGNVRLCDGLLLGALSPVGVVAGAVAANELPERALELGFAAVMLYFAFRLGRVALDPSSGPSAPRASASALPRD